MTTVPPPTLSIDDVQLAEGDSGSSNLVFTVTRNGDTSGTSSVDFATADGTATSGSDYAAIPTTTLNFGNNDTSKAITVQINGDTDFEADETFFVNLLNPTNATLTDAQGLGTIANDDIGISLSDGTITEGGSP